MKKLFYFLTLALFAGFTSCSDDDEDIFDIKFDGLTNNKVELVEGTSSSLKITSGNGNYAVVSSDESIVTAKVEDGDIIKVTGVKTGTANLTISDRHQSVTLNVTVTINDDTVIIEDSPAPASISSKGFYVVNEDWFGWDNGTVNYFLNDGSVIYRAYRAANPDETFGVTTQFATIYGDYAYVVSKQGNRMVVADATTLKKKAVFTDIGGDGRSFIGISPEKGYIGTGNGITVFNIKNLSMGGAIEGISGQVGNMSLVAGKAFAIVQSKGVYVINTDNNTVEDIIEGSFNCMTQSKDGNVWVSSSQKLTKINPYTLKTEEIALIGTDIGSSWGAWNAGSLCASTQQNVLYWSNSGKVIRYDIDNNQTDTEFYTLGKDSQEKSLAFYGAGLRVDPLTDKLVLNIKRSGWGDAGSYNWVRIIDKSGNLEKEIELKGDNGVGTGWGTIDERYFWFPAMPFFEDANKPSILLNQVVVKANERKAVCLSDKIVDADNMSTAIIKNVTFPQATDLVEWEIKQDSLVFKAGATTGKTKFILHANSNGQVVEKEIRLDIR